MTSTLEDAASLGASDGQTELGSVTTSQQLVREHPQGWYQSMIYFCGHTVNFRMDVPFILGLLGNENKGISADLDHDTRCFFCQVAQRDFCINTFDSNGERKDFKQLYREVINAYHTYQNMVFRKFAEILAGVQQMERGGPNWDIPVETLCLKALSQTHHTALDLIWQGDATSTIIFLATHEVKKDIRDSAIANGWQCETTPYSEDTIDWSLDEWESYFILYNPDDLIGDYTAQPRIEASEPWRFQLNIDGHDMTVTARLSSPPESFATLAQSPFIGRRGGQSYFVSTQTASDDSPEPLESRLFELKDTIVLQRMIATHENVPHEIWPALNRWIEKDRLDASQQAL